MAEGSLLERVRQRKLVQWALAYIGGSWIVRGLRLRDQRPPA